MPGAPVYQANEFQCSIQRILNLKKYRTKKPYLLLFLQTYICLAFFLFMTARNHQPSRRIDNPDRVYN